jgi:predicted DNA-binding transcriptional regulator YafY
VRLQLDKHNAPYIETKPLHHTQEVIERNDKGIIISLRVKLNYELEKELLGFGEGICVLQPLQLQKRMYHRLRTSLACYDAVQKETKDA